MKRLIIPTAVLALALPAVAWAHGSIVASPHQVIAGRVVKVSGSTGTGCAKGDRVTLLSRAFGRRHVFASVAAIYATSGNGGAFSTTTRIPRARRPGTYTITARCGGGNLGVTATLKVLRR